ncbi:hypothetical protein KAX02_03545 [candidate division WOR-3 bacterium]|nr:hypothetical protein [candidate division WOR-3 bacterium]
MSGYKFFKCLKCGKVFRVKEAGLKGDAFKTLACDCGSLKLSGIGYKEYNVIARGMKIRRKDSEKSLKEIKASAKKKTKKKKENVVTTRLFGFPPICGMSEYNSVSSTTERREGATKKEETEYGKNKKKKRKSSDSRRSRRVVVTR